MSELLTYKFYLNFKNEGSFGRIQISEPIGFDGSSFVVEQDDKRYGRDGHKINEEINLNFYKGNFKATNTALQLPDGTMTYSLTQGFDFIYETYRLHGFESDVDFEIESENVTFIPANLDFQTAETDEYTYFTCKALQSGDKQLLKRRSEIVTNIFSTEDLDGNTVTPATTENILLKAKPIVQVSEWQSANRNVSFEITGTRNYFYPVFNNVLSYGINDTLSSFDFYYDPNFGNEPDAIEDVRKVYAQTDLSDVNVNITNLNIDIDLGQSTTETEYAQVVVDYGLGFNSGEFTRYIAYEIENPPLNTQFSIENLDLDFNIGNVPNNGYIAVYVNVYFGTAGNRDVSVKIHSGNLKIKATSTAIDTVIKGVRYIDVFKENIKRVNGFTTYAPRFDVGGQYYDQFATTGNLIKQKDDVAFNVKFKTITEDLAEVNCDYQILNDKVYIGSYTDFYPNKEIGVFLGSPDEEFTGSTNERYALNEFAYKYKTYEQDRDESNTTDAIHTETQWLISNKKVENSKKIEVDLIRDAYKIEVFRKQALKNDTSTTDDDKMPVLDVVPLAPNTKGGFSALMQHNIDDDGNVQLLKDADLPSWALLGFGVGSTFEILSDDNTGTYTVSEIQTNVITLTPVTPSTQSFTGESYTEVEYPYTNVYWTNRTNEGLEYSENLLNPDNYSNLRYSIKRNIKTWHPYLATATQYSQNGTFKNTEFKDNGECITRFSDEAENIQENASILNRDFEGQILTPKIYKTRLLVKFIDMVNAIDFINTINSDDTIAGFIRCVDHRGKVIKLYPQKLDYLPSREVLELTGEERYEGDTLTITISSGTVTINEVGYEIDELSDPFYEFDGDYFKIYDANRLPVINPTRYDKITVNGLSFDSSSDLLGYLVSF